jgi:transcriptional regulator with XRE-family HTH domain
MAGLSQGQLAKLLKVHRPTISEIEAGNRSVSAEELGRLSELLDVSVTWIVGESPEKIDVEDPRVQLAARELGKLKPEDLDRLLKLLAAIKE